MRAGVYIRVSKGIQAKDGESLDMQEARARELCAKHGWEMGEPYLDVMTGKNDKRPALKRFEQDLRAGKFKAIVCYRVDRLGRTRRKLHEIIEYVQQHGIHLVSMTQPIDTSTASGRMMLGILVEFAVYESEQLGERVSDTLLHMAKQGRPVSGRAPYGYRHQRKRSELSPEGQEIKIQASITVDEQEAEGVRLAFATYLDRGIAAAAKALNASGYRTRRGKPWDVTGIRMMILNPLYGGERAVRRYPKAAGKQRSRSKVVAEMNEWLIVPGGHEAIVPPEITRRAREKYQAERDTPASVRTARNPWSGIIKCDRCGYRMTAAASQRDVTYFRCRHAQMQACDARNLPVAWLDHAVLPAIAKAIDSSSIVRRADAVAKRPRKIIPLAPASNDRLIAARIREMDRLEVRYSVEAITGEQYVSERKRILGEIEALKSAAPAPKAPAPAARLSITFRETWEGLDHADRRALLALFVREIAIDNERALVILQDFAGVDDLPSTLTVERWPRGSRVPREVRWAKEHDVCRSCRSKKHPHQARGLCRICYSQAKHQERKASPLIDGGRWSLAHDACQGCGTIEQAHCARGLCFRCYDRARRRETPRS